MGPSSPRALAHGRPKRTASSSRNVLLCALALVGTLLVALPAAGGRREAVRFLPGKSLDGARLGMTKRQLTEVWGQRHGVCRDCRHTTWYFNDQPFEPQGTAAVFEGGETVALFTVWRPPNSSTPEGLELGSPAAAVSRTYGPLERRSCSGYDALLDEGGRVTSVYYLFRDRLWGFGLTRAGASPCPR